jgi:hypothetical protein
MNENNKDRKYDDDSAARKIWQDKGNTAFDSANYVHWRGSVRQIVIMYEEPELQKLYEYFGPLCQDIWCLNTPESNREREKIRIPALDWAQNLINGVVETLTNEEDPMHTAFPIGTKVKHKGHGSGAEVKYGIVVLNKCWFLRSNRGDTPLETDWKVPEYFNAERMKMMCDSPQVEWFDKDGNKVCVGWHNPEALEELK